MSEPIRIECASCGLVYTEGHHRSDCPHEPTTSFTRFLVDQLRDRLRKESTR